MCNVEVIPISKDSIETMAYCMKRVHLEEGDLSTLKAIFVLRARGGGLTMMHRVY